MPVFLTHGDHPFQKWDARGEGSVRRPLPRELKWISIATPATASPVSASTIVTAIIAKPTATSVLTGFGLVNGQAPTADLVIVQPLNGRLRLAFGAHLHEAEPFSSARTTVSHHFRAVHGAELREQLLQLGVADLVGQIPNKQPRTHSDAP